MTTRLEHDHKELCKEVEILRKKLASLERDAEFYKIHIDKWAKDFDKVTKDYQALKRTIKLLVGDE